MPNYLADEQIIITRSIGPGSSGHYVEGRRPTTGALLWWVRGSGAATGYPAATLTLPGGPHGGVVMSGAANTTRTRLYILSDQGELYILDQTFAVLSTIDLQPMATGTFGNSWAVQVYPNGQVLVLIVANNPTLSEPQLLRLNSAGTLLQVYANLAPVPIESGGRQSLTLALSPDGTRAAYFEGLRAPKAFVEPFTVPPGLECGDPDILGGGYGDTVYLYNLTAAAPHASVVVSAVTDRRGVGLAHDLSLLTGETHGSLSCNVVAAACPFADTVFGTGLARQHDSSGGVTQTYPVDPGCVWMEEDTEILTRDASSFWDITGDWTKEFTVIVDAELSVSPDYREHWRIEGPGSPAQYLRVISEASGSDENMVLQYDIGAGVVESDPFTLTPFTRAKVRVQYKAAEQTLYYFVNCALVEDLTGVDFSGAEIDGSVETHGYVRGAPFGITAERMIVGTDMVSKSTLTGLTDLTDSAGGHDWTADNGLEDWADRAGSEQSPIGMSLRGTRFWYAKYVREFRNSRVMFLERRIDDGVAKRFFLTTIQDDITQEICATLADDDEPPSNVLEEEATFEAGGVSGPLAWLELTLKTEPE